MSSASKKIIVQALSLPDEERLEVAEHLLDTVIRQSSDEVARAWAGEAVRRATAVERGEVQAVDGELAISRLEASLRTRHNG